jgi:hypothetical protein
VSDRFLQGFMEDFIRGVSSPITTSVGGGGVPPVLNAYTDSSSVNYTDSTDTAYEDSN